MTHRLKVMQVTHDLGVGGLPRVVETLCRTIDPARFDVSVLCLRGKGPLADALEADGFSVTELQRPVGRPDYFAFRRVARVLREKQIDVIHTHNTEPFVNGTIGALIAGTRPVVVHTDHARPFPDMFRHMLSEHVLSYFARAMVGVSEHTTDNLRRYEKIPERKLHTIVNGIEGGRYAARGQRAAVRAALGIADDALVIGFASRLAEQKGVPFLLEASVGLAARFPGLHVLIAGAGELDAELRARSSALGLDGTVRFLGERLDVAELVQAFDVFVLPSLWEGLPMVILEAMAIGCPIVATAVGGVPHALEHDVSAWLVPPSDVHALESGLATVLSDAAQRARFSSNARRRFDERYSAERMAREYESLYLAKPSSHTRQLHL